MTLAKINLLVIMPRARTGATINNLRSLFIAVLLWNAAHAQKWATELTWPKEFAEHEISEWAGFSKEALRSQEWNLSEAPQDDFSEQVGRVVDNVTISEERLTAVSRVLRDLEQVFNVRWPGSRVVVFGSLTYGLALRNGDIDCTLLLPSSADATSTLEAASNALRLHPHFTNPYPITWARIPVITFEHTPTQFKIDLTVNNFAGIQSSNMLRYLLHLNDRIYKLALVVKHWASRQITAYDDPALSNYGLTLMVVFYLQQRNMMPTIASLQVNAESFFDDEWNTGYCEIEYNMQNNYPLQLLLGEFFKYYAGFDYDKYIVSPYVGYPVEKSGFSDLKKVPREFSLYVHNIHARQSAPLTLDNPLVLQDMFIHNQNLAKSVDTRPNSTFLEQFQIAAKEFKENNMDFLENLLR